MLRARGDAALLDSPDITRGYLSCKIRVFTEILEIPAAERIALDIHTRTQQHRDILTGRLFAKMLAYPLSQLRIP